MILIIGGEGAGKRRFVEAMGFAEADFTENPLDARPVLDKLHLLLQRQPMDERLLTALLAKQIVICNEVGCGIVPLDADERAWREQVGRACCTLAESAEQVIRLCCGLPQYLKGGPGSVLA